MSALHRCVGLGLPGVPLVQLFDARAKRPGDVLASGGTLTYGEMATPAGLRKVARYADVASPSKDYIVPRDATGRSLAPTTFIGDAHAAGLEVVAYTFRNENAFLPLELRSSVDPAAYGNAIAEYRQFFELGIDGVFSDNPDAAKARARRRVSRAISARRRRAASRRRGRR